MKTYIIKDQVFRIILPYFIIIFCSTKGYGQIPIDIEANSNVGLPHLRITEIGQDYSRITFQNTANPNKFWTIAGETHGVGIPRINFYYNSGTEARDRFTVTGAGKIGINNTNPQANLHVIGDVRVSTLASSGLKNVYVTSNGTLTAGTTTRYYSIPASAFHPSINESSKNWISEPSRTYFLTAPSDSATLIAPVMLPHGSTIKKITVFYEDIERSVNVDFILSYYDSDKVNCPILCTTIGHIDRIAVIESSYGSGTKSSEKDNLNIVIDNSSRSYSFRMDKSSNIETRGGLSYAFKINQVVIEYID